MNSDLTTVNSKKGIIFKFEKHFNMHSFCQKEFAQLTIMIVAKSID